MRLNGKAHLPLIAEILNIDKTYLYNQSRNPDFPEVEHRISGVRLYDVSKVARYLGVPLR